MIQRALVVTTGNVITCENLPATLGRGEGVQVDSNFDTPGDGASSSTPSSAIEPAAVPTAEDPSLNLGELERRTIERAVRRAEGNLFAVFPGRR